MIIKIQLENNGTGEDSRGASVLEAIRDSRVFKITKLDDGRFEIRETCDNWFHCVLTKGQLKTLGKEIINLAKG